jgi:GntR family transcriptional repressor for pyruvate dehydrogenase complex
MEDTIRSLLSPPKKERLHESIVSQVKSLIFTKELKVGQKLPSERELSELLKVSRVVIREALRSLEQSGFIDIKPGPGGGAFVTDNTYKPFFNSTFDLFNEGKLTLHHFFEARQAIERLSVQLAAKRATAKDIERLKAINKQLIDDREDKAKLRENNRKFHEAIADISGNPLIKLMVLTLIELLDAIYPRSEQPVSFIEDTHKRHEAIISAIKNKKADMCEKMMDIDTASTAKLKVR